MTIRVGFDPAAQRALEAWRIVTRGMLSMAANLPRLTLFGRQRHACYLCGREFDPRAAYVHGGHNSSPSRDHVFPRSENGGAVCNILLAHKSCNGRKGDRWPYPCEVLYLAAVYAAPAPPMSRNARRKAKTFARRK